MKTQRQDRALLVAACNVLGSDDARQLQQQTISAGSITHTRWRAARPRSALRRHNSTTVAR